MKQSASKAPLFAPANGLFLRALTALCIGFGCAWPLLLAMNLAPSAALCAACCAALSLLLALGECLPRLRIPALLLPLLAVLGLVWSLRDQAPALLSALTLFLNGQPLALAAYSRAITVLVSLALTGFGALLADGELSLFPQALLACLVLLLVSLTGLPLSPLMLLPLPAALLLSCRARHVRAARLLPMAALALALTLSFLPFAGQIAQPLADLAQQTRQTIEDYLFFTAPRTAFSLSSTGYQPLGQQQLGGTALPTDDPVMQVKTPGRALLRAAIKNHYTGLAWADTTSGRRYLWVNPSFFALRRDLFDQARPDKALLPLLPAARTIEVALQADTASTLYLTQRFLSPRGEHIVSYFSPSSEVFATRNLAAGSRYTFSGRLMDASTPGIREAVLTACRADDPYAETVRSLYLQLPSSVEPQVHALAQSLTASADNDFDRAAALCLYLQRSFPYSLTQSEPPTTREFVSWFLLEEKRGYCTSFASALTVMARSIGLPARYIEGYAAQPDSDGIARVTQQNAHAWTEIYFPGFGWLPFDPTPGSASAPDGSGQEQAPDAPEPESGDTSPSPLPSPEPTPSPTPTPVPTPSPSPTPAHNDPAITPTPPITPSPTPAPSAPPTPRPPEPPERNASALWLLLLLALLAVLCAVRLALVAPARLAALHRSPDRQVLVWYLAAAQALTAMGLPIQSGEAPAAYLLRAQQALGEKLRLDRLGEALYIAQYSAHHLKRSAVEKAETIYRALYAHLTAGQRLRLHAHRFLHGIRPE